MSEEKSRAQIEYEKHFSELLELQVPGPLKRWDELTELVRGIWKKEYPEIDKEN